MPVTAAPQPRPYLVFFKPKPRYRAALHTVLVMVMDTTPQRAKAEALEHMRKAGEAHNRSEYCAPSVHQFTGGTTLYL